MDVEWRGFELHPETPPGGRPLDTFFPAPRIPAMRAWMRAFAADFGVRIGLPDRIPNTRKALAACEYAREHGALRPLCYGLMDAHWRDLRDIEDDGVLADAARGIGLDPGAAVAAARDPRWLARVDAAREEAADLGVTGIPTFFLDRLPIVGCQPYASLARAAERVGARRLAGDGALERSATLPAP